MRTAFYLRLSTALVLIAAGLTAPLALAQGMNGMGGGARGIPAPGGPSLKNKDREIIGLSLAATDEPVLEVRIVGNNLIPTSQILNEMQTRVGRPYDPTLLQRDVRKLTTRSWFVNVKTELEQRREGWIITLKVVERPTIRYIEYLGNKKIREKKLAKETGLKVNGSVDPYSVEEGRRKIIDLYQRNGFNNVHVSVMEGNKATDQGVVYVINEGQPQKIWKVEFIGAEFVRGQRLKTQIESKPPIMYFFKGYVDRDQIDADVDKLTAYYRSFGFFQAKVGRKLEYNEKGNWVTLKFIVNEGPRYSVRNVSYMGNKIFADSSLEMGATLPDGAPFEQSKMNRDVEWLKTLYGSQGYVFADINAEPVFLEEPGKIDLVYHIDEGKQWRVGRIFVHIDGENPHTRIQTALNRLSIRPGQIVDIREIHASERRLQASSLFLTDPARGTAPKITYRIQDLENEQFAAEEAANFRGQSPDATPISVYKQPVGRTYELQPPAGFVPTDDAMDVHLYVEPPPQQPAPAPVAAPQPSVQSHSTYDQLVVRTQSPYQPPTTQPYGTAAPPPGAYGTVVPSSVASPANPYAALGANGASAGYPAPANPQAAQTVAPPPASVSPAAAYASGDYGGRPVAATGPDSTPVGHNAQQVQPAQYAEPMAAPGTLFGPPPVVGPPPGPPPGAMGPPGITPIPNDPTLFPSGAIEPWARPFEGDPAVDIFVDAAEAQTGRLMVGAAVNSDAGLFGQILLDEQNFDCRRWPTSMEDVVSGRAWRGGGQRFRLEAMPGTQVQRYVISFQEPYLWDTPVSLGTSASYYDRRFQDWDEQRLGGRVALGYQWVANDVSTSLSYRGENVKIYNPANPTFPDLAEVHGSNALHGLKLSVANDTRDSAFFPTSGHYFEISGEQVIGSFTYPRAMLDLREYGLITERPDHSGRHVLSYATTLGFTGSNTPIYDRFYSGGIMFRGFEFHTVTPIEDGIQVGGDFMWVNTLEYLFPLTADDMLHGALFCDFGTVEKNIAIDWDQFRVSPGFGFRVTIPAMGPAPIALDFAFPVASARTDDESVFTFNIGFAR